MMGMEMMEIKEMRSENEIMFPPIGGAGSRSGDEAGVICSRLACHEGLDEELSVLPRHTKVIVTGNNRTKSVLVGLQGVVKKAVGLGGWHWLVLTNGLEVKLQRNALSVLEPPTGLEEDNDSDDGNPNVEENQRPFKLRMQPQRSSAPKGAHRSHLVDISPTCPKPSHRLLKVNLGKLETTALLRYWRRFNLVSLMLMLVHICPKNSLLMLWRGISAPNN